MTFAELEQWHKLSDLDKYAKRLIFALKPEFVVVKRDRAMARYEVCLRKDDLVRIVPFNLQDVDVTLKERTKDVTGCVYKTEKGDIFLSSKGKVYTWKHKVGERLANQDYVLYTLLLHKVVFRAFTVSPEIKQAFNRLEKLGIAPGWWRCLVKHIQPECLMVRSLDWWEPNTDETLYPSASYKLGF